MKTTLAFLLMATLLLPLSSSDASGQTIEVSLRGRPTVLGKPVYWNDGFVALIERDGQIVTFSPSQAKKYRKVSSDFSSYSQGELSGRLLREFGGAFDVSGTGQYLVVHPAGQRDRWAERFEQLYRSMIHYFSARGFAVRRPEFPFVAVVFPTQHSYDRYMEQQNVKIGYNSLGYYDPSSNRIHLYDVTAGNPNSERWYINAETIIHEAAHQTAYNIGVHRRYGYTPAWVVEGIGTLFESRGVWNPAHYPQQNDRIHQYQLRQYMQRVNDDNSLAILKQQIVSDRVFKQSYSLAYAHAWAMTFYLMERQPRDFAAYIARINRRESFQAYSGEQRLRDFRAVFGENLEMFDARLQRFIQTL